MSAMYRLLQDEEEKLYGLFLYKTGDPNEARDLLQDLYESVLCSLDSFALVEDQTAWLFRAAHNRITDWYRKRSRRKELSLDHEEDESGSLLDVLANIEGLEDRFFRDALYEALFEAVDALPEKLGSVIREQALEGKSFRVLAEEWDIPMGTLLSRKREALRLLREALEDFSDVWHEMVNGRGRLL